MAFVDLPIEANPAALVAEALGEMETLIEGWRQSDAEYETILIQAIVYRIFLPLLAEAANVPEEIFKAWGEDVVEVQPHEALPATAKTTWTAEDTSGYPIPAGTEVAVEVTGGESVPFRTVEEASIPPGSNAVSDVLIEAIEPGAETSGLEGKVTPIDALGWVKEIALQEATAGGEDAEDALVYLGRLAEVLQTLVEGVVLARDVGILARSIPGIGRALVLDNYDYETEDDEAEKTTSVIVATAAGLPTTSKAKGELADALEERREINYVFYVEDPTYSEVRVTAAIVEQAGFSHADVVGFVQQAILDFLNPETAGQQPPGEAGTWVSVKTLRFQDLVTVVNNAQGVGYYTTLKWAVAAGTQEQKDLTLAGVAPLPKSEAAHVVVT